MKIIGVLFVCALSFCIPYGPLALGVILKRKRWKVCVPVALGSLLVPFGPLVAGVGMQLHAAFGKARAAS